MQSFVQNYLPAQVTKILDFHSSCSEIVGHLGAGDWRWCSFANFTCWQFPFQHCVWQNSSYYTGDWAFQHLVTLSGFPPFPSFLLSTSNLNLIKPRLPNFLNVNNNKVTSSKVKTQYDLDNRNRIRQLNSNQVNRFGVYSRTHKSWLSLPSLNLFRIASSQSINPWSSTLWSTSLTSFAITI
jgi:hypothetical protein